MSMGQTTRKSHKRLATFAALLTAGVLLAGCAANNRETVRPSDDRTGAARGVPAEAYVVAEGKPPLSFLYSGHGGTLYVYDQTSDALIHTADFGPNLSTTGGIVMIDVERKMLVLNDANKNSVTLVSQIDPSHRFTMWFLPPPGARPGQRNEGVQ
jgi:hypothetical protein